MNRWEASDSIFAPIVAAVPPDTRWAGFTQTLTWSAQGIPQATLTYSVKRPGSFKRVRETRDRKAYLYTSEAAKPFTAQVRLGDTRRGETRFPNASETLWVVGMSRVKDGLCAPAVPDDFDTAILQPITLRLDKGGVSGAPQLALMRHRWSEAVQAASPDAIVFGGQRDWNDAWWTELIDTEGGDT